MKYNQVMSRLELSADARARILNNVAPKRSKVIPFKVIRRYAAAVACLAVILLAAYAIPKLRQSAEEPTETSVSNGVTDYDTAEELSAAMGFEIETLSDLSFEPQSVSYTNMFGETAQVEYTDGEKSATFRKAIGNEDISGDYNEYGDILEIQVQGVLVTLKGNEVAYSLALWQRDGYSYSLAFEPAVTEADIIKALNTIIK